MSADYVSGHIGCYAILNTDEQPIRCEVGLNQLSCPTGVICLHQDEHDVELMTKLRYLAQVHDTHLRHGGFMRHLNLDALATHSLYVLGPLFDERDVVPCPN